MHYLKRNNKYSILAILVIVFSTTISIFTFVKTEICFSLNECHQKEIIKNIHQANIFNNVNITK